jgi:hypothetical protein
MERMKNQRGDVRSVPKSVSLLINRHPLVEKRPFAGADCLGPDLRRTKLAFVPFVENVGIHCLSLRQHFNYISGLSKVSRIFLRISYLEERLAGVGGHPWPWPQDLEIGHLAALLPLSRAWTRISAKSINQINLSGIL